MKTKTLLRITAILTLVATPWFLSSCATHTPAPQTSASGIPWNEPTGGRPQTAYKTPENSSPQSMSRPISRPGLGTGWGAEIPSKINHTNFTRSSTKPHGISTIYYNDKEGIKAMTRAWCHTGSGMQRAAGGLVEWGIKGSWGYLNNFQSNGRRYIVGHQNRTYTIVIKNLCHSRLELVLSVDGLDVIDGRTASTRKRGYILQPGKTLTIKGFRTSESTVAAFKFSSVSSSYSNQRHGTTRNVGVIGIAVFTEKGTSPWKWSCQAVQQRHNASPFTKTPPAYTR